MPFCEQDEQEGGDAYALLMTCRRSLNGGDKKQNNIKTRRENNERIYIL